MMKQVVTCFTPKSSAQTYLFTTVSSGPSRLIFSQNCFRQPPNFTQCIFTLILSANTPTSFTLLYSFNTPRHFPNHLFLSCPSFLVDVHLASFMALKSALNGPASSFWHKAGSLWISVATDWFIKAIWHEKWSEFNGNSQFSSLMEGEV